MAIAAGRLNKRVTILAPQTRLSGANEATTKHRAVWRVWAEVKQAPADETLADGRVVARVKYTILMRYRDDVDETCRVQIGDRELPISSVVERGTREELEVTAHEVR